MADTLESLVQWGVDNAHLKGTPEFEANKEKYKALRNAAQGGGSADAPLNPGSVKSALADKFGSFVKTAAEDTAANPGGFSAATGRVVTGAATGVPDLGIGIYNAGARLTGNEGSQVDYVGPQVNQALGGAPMPADAGTGRQLAEAGLSALLGGGANAIARAGAAAPSAARAAIPMISKLFTTTVAPTVGAHWGGQGGEIAAKSMGLDPETGALLGSLLGGAAPGVASRAPARFTDWRYRGMGKPNAGEIMTAAENQNVTPTAGMLGNEQIRARENTYANKFGASDFTNARRTEARTGVGEAWDRMAEARGALEPNPTESTIGYNVARVAREGVADAEARSSTGQQDLMNQIGRRADMDAAPIVRSIQDVRRATDPLTAAPLDARLTALRRMIAQNPANFDADGNQIASNIPYERGKDFRTGLRISGEGYDPVPGRHAGTVYDATTGAMRGAAVDQGVAPDFFDTVQGRTARLTGEGSPVEQLTPVGAGESTGAYNYLNEGVQNPQRLRMLQNTGNPLMDRVFGDYLRKLGNETINSPNQGAPGPRQLATRIESMPDETRAVVGGPQEPAMMDIATLARALNFPTSQSGLGRTMGPLTGGIPGTLTAGEIGSAVGGATTIPGGGTAGRVLGYLSGPARRMVGGRMMQGDTALNALAGRPYEGNYGISDLVAAINAASIPQKQGM